MAYYRYPKKKETDNLSLLKRVIQWAYYRGGLSFVFIIFGMVLIGAFALFSFGGVYNWVVLILGCLFIGGGLYIHFKIDKK